MTTTNLALLMCLAATAAAAQLPATRPAPARTEVVGPTAPLLVGLGGTYLCDQRVYAEAANLHISAWEWAFDDDPQALTEKLTKLLTGAERDGSIFRWKGVDGRVAAVVAVEEGSTSPLQCSNGAASTKSRVVASQM